MDELEPHGSGQSRYCQEKGELCGLLMAEAQKISCNDGYARAAYPGQKGKRLSYPDDKSGEWPHFFTVALRYEICRQEQGPCYAEHDSDEYGSAFINSLYGIFEENSGKSCGDCADDNGHGHGEKGSMVFDLLDGMALQQIGQAFSCVNEDIAYSGSKDNEYGDQCSKMQANFQPDALAIKIEEVLGDDQVARTADGQKFRNPLYDAQDNK